MNMIELSMAGLHAVEEKTELDCLKQLAPFGAISGSETSRTDFCIAEG